jgi:hypothetical protein
MRVTDYRNNNLFINHYLGENSDACKKNWIAGAIKKKGSLRKTLGAKRLTYSRNKFQGSKVRILSAVASLGYQCALAAISSGGNRSMP